MTIKLDEFRDWAETAQPGEQFVYHTTAIRNRSPALFDFARELSDAHKVILFQREVLGAVDIYGDEAGDPVAVRVWHYVAQACSCRASAWLERAAHPLPDRTEPPIIAPKFYGSAPGGLRRSSGRAFHRE